MLLRVSRLRQSFAHEFAQRDDESATSLFIANFNRNIIVPANHVVKEEEHLVLQDHHVLDVVMAVMRRWWKFS